MQNFFFRVPYELIPCGCYGSLSTCVICGQDEAWCTAPNKSCVERRDREVSSPLWENEKLRMRTTDPSVRVRFMGIHKKITAREAGREQKGNDINPSFQNKSDYDGFLIYAQVIRINLKFILYK